MTWSTMVSMIEREHDVPPSSVQQEMNFDLLEVVHEWAKGKVRYR